MRGFALDSSGDVIMKDGDIVFTGGDDLTRQTMETVLGTNKGEWFNNEDEGIRFSHVLGKNVNTDIVRDEMQQGISQVDEDFYVDDFVAAITGRKLSVGFTARRLTTDESIDLTVSYG